MSYFSRAVNPESAAADIPLLSDPGWSQGVTGPREAGVTDIFPRTLRRRKASRTGRRLGWGSVSRFLCTLPVFMVA